MMTNANLLSLARKFDIYADEPKLLDSEIVRDMLSRTTFEQILYSPPGSGTAAFEVSFDPEDPDLAAEVASGHSISLRPMPGVSLKHLLESMKNRPGNCDV